MYPEPDRVWLNTWHRMHRNRALYAVWIYQENSKMCQKAINKMCQSNVLAETRICSMLLLICYFWLWTQSNDSQKLLNDTTFRTVLTPNWIQLRPSTVRLSMWVPPGCTFNCQELTVSGSTYVTAMVSSSGYIDRQ
jgi:hypothetical protein